MKKRIGFKLLCVTFLVLILCFVPALLIKAADEASPLPAEDCLVYDFADLIPDSQEKALEEFALKYGKKQKIDYIILTVSRLSGVEQPAPERIRSEAVEALSEAFYTSYTDQVKKAKKDVILMTVYYSGIEGDNFIDTSGYGIMKETLDTERATMLSEKMASIMRDGDFLKAFKTGIQKADRYIRIKPGMNPELFLFKLWFQIGCPLVLALIVILIMVHNSGGKVTVSQSTYLDASSPGVIGRYDRFIRKSVTRHKIESSSNHSGSNKKPGKNGSHGGSSF